MNQNKKPQQFKKKERKNGSEKVDDPNKNMLKAAEKQVQKATELKINDLLNDPEKTQIVFPANFSNVHRRFVHMYAKRLGLKSKSEGKEPNRILTVYKEEKKPAVIRDTHDTPITITDISSKRIFYLLKNQPVTQKDSANLTPTKKDTIISPYRFNEGTMNRIVLGVPPHPGNVTHDIARIRMGLPIFDYRTRLIEMIDQSRSLVVVGETGSGKTTQVPQYILEHCADTNLPCRIICAQPRRLSAISVAERVAYERGEVLGHTVGYQIRLEGKTSPSSNLIYCTNGILLRCLMSSNVEEVFEDITHVIVDEVHERDKFSDFLFISLRRALQSSPHLKVILMSATIDADLFTNYLQCPKIEIPGKIHPVQTYFLEDVLVKVEYRNSRVQQILEHEDNEEEENELLAAIERVKIDPESTEMIDELVQSIFLNGDEDSCAQFVYLIEAEDLDINYKHSETSMTALMAATAKGLLPFVQQLLALGADPSVKSEHGFTALDLALKCNQLECGKVLMEAKPHGTNVKDLLKEKLRRRKYEEILLQAYTAARHSDEIDHELLFKLIQKIHRDEGPGAILVFLPGFVDIVEQSMMIDAGLNMHEYQLFMLHSSMETKGQRNVFTKMPKGVRKIVLATNIAETSITIDDVVYVIDAGFVKQQTFDAVTGSSCLAITSISRACAKQRTGRAGRCQPGICYRLYSRDRFNEMAEYTLPELLRVPLTDICIQAKLIGNDMRIQDYLKLAIQPPSDLNVSQSIQILKTIGALDEAEELTQMGTHLGDLPIDVKLGKTLLFGIFMRCLDPILTIVSAISAQDPFMIPKSPEDRSKLFGIKHSWGEGAFSDHLVLLRVYQKWSDERTSRGDRAFCNNHFVRAGTMETISGIRAQLLGNLRALGFIRSSGPGNIHDLNEYSNQWSVVKACLAAGLYPNVAQITGKGKRKKMVTSTVKMLQTHRHSIVVYPPKASSNGKKPAVPLPTDWIVFEEKVRIMSNLLTYTNTVVTPVTIALMAGSLNMTEEQNLYELEDEDSDEEESDWSTDEEYEVKAPQKIDRGMGRHRFHVDEWIHFISDTTTIFLIFKLRQKLFSTFHEFLANSRNFFYNPKNSQIISTVAQILIDEDASVGFPALNGIGKPPSSAGLSLPTCIRNFSFPPQTNGGRGNYQGQYYNNHHQGPPQNGQQQQPRKRLDYAPQERQQPRVRNRRRGRGGREHPKKPEEVGQHQNENPNQFSTRFFIVKAASAEQVIDASQNNTWTFSASVRTLLNRLKRQNPFCRIFILFNVSHPVNLFCCLTEYTIEMDQYRLKIVSQQRRSYEEMLEIYKKTGIQANPEFFDGQEIPLNAGQFIFQSLIN